MFKIGTNRVPFLIIYYSGPQRKYKFSSIMNIITSVSTLTYFSLYAEAAVSSRGLSAPGRVEGCCRSDRACDIVPDVVAKVLCYYDIGINYTSYDVTVDSCKELSPNQAQAEPDVSYRADPSCRYLMAMVDLDASQPELLHWLVVNIPGDAVKKGVVLAAYLSPAPPKGTGLHRYTFLLYKQPGKLTFDLPMIPANSTENRTGFSIRDFAKKYRLGCPNASVFLAQHQ